METYKNLIEKTFEFPNDEFQVNNNQLFFNGVNIQGIVEKYGTPLRLTYLPKVGEKIQTARNLFEQAFKKLDYKGKYIYSYCTKSNHFKFIIEETLKHGSQLETSSAFDIDIIEKLYQEKKLEKDILIICNGFKRPQYISNIIKLINQGFENCTPILDHLDEIKSYREEITKDYNIGIRCASDEEPQFEFYTSRLGIRYTDIIEHYQKEIAPYPNIKLKILHFFINSGIKDSSYYWSELNRLVHKYCKLKKVCPELDTLDIGGGFPIKTSLNFSYDFENIVTEITKTVQRICKENEVQEPNIITEFGSYTVAESGAMIYSILNKKLQNDKELWYMIDSSFITNMPDTWAINQRFILLGINNWEAEYENVNLGGLTCDSKDYYNSETHSSNVVLPRFNPNKEQQYIGFFHTGAYQEAIGGYGGIQHCLIPNTKHIVITKNETGDLVDTLFEDEQTSEAMLKILGFLG
jgi:arginine decarboxylase